MHTVDEYDTETHHTAQMVVVHSIIFHHSLIKHDNHDNQELHLVEFAGAVPHPEELQQGISSQECCEREQRFFREHPELKHIGEEYKGIPALSRKLVQIQDQCIQSHLPTLQKEVISSMVWPCQAGC